MTLIEIMIVVTLIAALVGITAFSLGLVGRADAQAKAREFTGVIRFVYNQAATRNETFQLVIDLDNNTYSVDILDTSGGLSRDELSGSFLDRDVELESESRAGRVDDEDTAFGGVLERTPLEGPLLEEKTFPEGVAFLGVMTSHHEELQVEGLATINFFPSGFVERSVIYIGGVSEKSMKEVGRARVDGAVYTLLVNPLTGQTTLRSGWVEVEEEFFEAEEDSE